MEQSISTIEQAIRSHALKPWVRHLLNDDGSVDTLNLHCFVTTGYSFGLADGRDATTLVSFVDAKDRFNVLRERVFPVKPGVTVYAVLADMPGLGEYVTLVAVDTNANVAVRADIIISGEPFDDLVDTSADTVAMYFDL